MKLIKAIIKPSKLDDVREALIAANIVGMTVSEVRGFGRQRGQTAIYRGTEYQTSFVPKLKIEIIIDDDMVDKAIEAISATAKSGQIGDGKIFVLDVAEAIRIRTGETGVNAL